MTDAVEQFLDAVDVRLDAGAQQYGDQSFVKPVAATVREIIEEAEDQVGWLYVLWCQAARKTEMVRDQKTLRAEWRERVEHRIRRNDRRAAHDPHAWSANNCMLDLEVLALDLFQHHEQLHLRLQPIARAIEVAHAFHHRPFEPDYRGRRGSVRDPRSDD